MCSSENVNISISVCMATYNGEKFIRKQIDSILLQLGANDELIISDNFSRDKTIDIINSFNDSRIKLIFHKKNESLMHMQCSNFRLAADNFSNAMMYAKGDFIFLADQDDIWINGRINTMMYYLQTNDLVMCNYSVINDSDLILVKKYLDKNPVSKYFIKNLFSTPFLGCTMGFSKKILTYCLPFPKALIGHDLWIGSLVCILGKFKYMETPFHYYRRHISNVSSATGKSKNRLMFKITYRIVFITQIFIRCFSFYLKKTGGR